MLTAYVCFVSWYFLFSGSKVVLIRNYLLNIQVTATENFDLRLIVNLQHRVPQCLHKRNYNNNQLHESCPENAGMRSWCRYFHTGFLCGVKCRRYSDHLHCREKPRSQHGDCASCCAQLYDTDNLCYLVIGAKSQLLQRIMPMEQICIEVSLYLDFM